MKTITLLAALALALAGCATTEQQEKLAFDTYAQQLRSGLMERMEQATGKTWKDWTVEQRALVNSLYLQGLKDYVKEKRQEDRDRAIIQAINNLNVKLGH